MPEFPDQVWEPPGPARELPDPVQELPHTDWELPNPAQELSDPVQVAPDLVREFLGWVLRSGAWVSGACRVVVGLSSGLVLLCGVDAVLRAVVWARFVVWISWASS